MLWYHVRKLLYTNTLCIFLPYAQGSRLVGSEISPFTWNRQYEVHLSCPWQCKPKTRLIPISIAQLVYVSERERSKRKSKERSLGQHVGLRHTSKSKVTAHAAGKRGIRTPSNIKSHCQLLLYRTAATTPAMHGCSSSSSTTALMSPSPKAPTYKMLCDCELLSSTFLMLISL